MNTINKYRENMDKYASENPKNHDILGGIIGYAGAATGIIMERANVIGLNDILVNAETELVKHVAEIAQEPLLYALPRTELGEGLLDIGALTIAGSIGYTCGWSLNKMRN